MVDLLLYIDISCINATDIIGRINDNQSISNQIKVELVEVIQEAVPKCPWDAND
jgi:hypothetical protein